MLWIVKKRLSDILINHNKKIRFLIAGGVNTLVGLSIYPILYIILEPIGVGYIKILLLAQLISITFSFITSKYFVFKTKGNSHKEYIKFFIFYGFYGGLNLLCLPIFVEILKITPIISQTIFSVAVIFSSYFWHNFITFKQPTESV